LINKQAHKKKKNTQEKKPRNTTTLKPYPISRATPTKLKHIAFQKKTYKNSPWPQPTPNTPQNTKT